MAKKTAAKYTLSRKAAQKKIDAIYEKIEDFELYSSSINDVENLLSEIGDELSDISWELIQTE